jgi:hypothetical protein
MLLELSLPLMLSPRTTVSLMQTTLLNRPRRNLLLALAFLRPANLMKAASRTRSGRTPNPLARMRKKISSLDQAGRPSVNGSVSRSSFSRLTNVSSRPLSVADVAASVAVVAVGMEAPEVVEEREDSVGHVGMEPAVDVDVVMVPTEEHHAGHHEPLPEVRLSTPTIRLLFLVWDRNLLTTIQIRLSLVRIPALHTNHRSLSAKSGVIEKWESLSIQRMSPCSISGASVSRKSM